MAFEKHRPINARLFWPTFNYPKFHAMSHFVEYVRKYGSAVNYDITYSEVVHKYLLKAFYRWINKKEYELQIL